MTIFRSVIIGGLALYLLLLGAVYLLQRDFLYVDRHHSAVAPPAGFQVLPVTTADGLALNSWYAPATTKPLTIVYFHGNGDRLETAAHIAAPYIQAGYGFLLAEYRGYSGLPGTPTEAGLYADARAYLQGLMAKGVAPENLVLLGYSLGTGIAVQLATEQPVRGLILMAPYTSIARMAQLRFPYLPAKYLARDRYDSLAKIGQVHASLLFTNGGADEIIPPAQGQALFAAANQPKQFYFVPSAHHNNLFEGDFVPLSLAWLAGLYP